MHLITPNATTLCYGHNNSFPQIVFFMQILFWPIEKLNESYKIQSISRILKFKMQNIDLSSTCFQAKQSN